MCLLFLWGCLFLCFLMLAMLYDTLTSQFITILILLGRSEEENEKENSLFTTLSADFLSILVKWSLAFCLMTGDKRL